MAQHNREMHGKYMHKNTVEPPNKGHVGDNINSTVLSFIERLSSFRSSQCIKTIEKVIFGTLSNAFCRGILYSAPISEGPLLKHYMVVKREGLLVDRSVGLNYNTHTGTIVQVEVQMMS